MHAYTHNMSQEHISYNSNNNNSIHMGQINSDAIDLSEEQYFGLGVSLVPSYPLPLNTYRRHSSFQSSPSPSQSGSPLGLESISLDELSYGVMTTPVSIPSKEWSRKSNPSTQSSSAPTPFVIQQVPQAMVVTTPYMTSSPLAPSWNIGIASNDSTSFASVPQLTSVPTEDLLQNDIVVPSQQVPHFQGSLGSPQPLQYHPRHRQIQRPRQKKTQLQIMTSEQQQGFAPMALGYTTPCVFEMQPTPVDTHITRAHPQTHHNHQGYPWGFVSSPVDSCFSSGTSTPSFASPSSSYTNSDMPSCESSRATSPSLYTHHNPYDSYLSERRLKRLEDSANIIRSRKSSTSSTSSLASRRMSTLRESPMSPTNSGNNTAMASSTVITPASSSHQCPKCNQCFAGPAVLVRHIESIHDKLMWNCVGCKSNLSRRDAVTRHINLSPMDSICRSVGTIGQVKTSNGVEVHYEVSSYRAKPLDEVMSRMGKKISSALRKEIDRSKAAAAAAAAAEFGMSTTLSVAPVQHHHQYRHEEYATHQAASMQEMLDSMQLTGQGEEFGMLAEGQEDDDFEDEYLSGDDKNKRRRASVVSLGRKKKL
ncbi:hypothetical protein BGZ93_011253 [Podila epicladia]|nr:hypothetical protein BGZ93_011253 [Podila epicladia]